MAQTGYTPISIYYSATTTNVPTAGNLVAGELAINTADGKLFYKDSAGAVQVIGTKGGVGSATTTQVLYNSSGLVVGSANMTFNGTTLTLANDASISGLTVGKGGGAVSNNTALGNGAIGTSNTGNYNTGVGYQTLYNNTSGNNSSAFGWGALLANTASNNTAVGSSALLANTSGTPNVAVGYQALLNNTSGSSNTALGAQSLLTNTTASNNTAVGYQAGYSQTAGSTYTGYNAFFGWQAGNLATNDLNTFIGAGAGKLVTTGGLNTILGSFSGNQGGLDIRTANNYIVLSDGAGNPRGVFDGSGNLFVGGATALGNAGWSFYGSGTAGASITKTNGTATFTHVEIKNGNGTVGSIQSTGSITLYNTTSDYRLKNVIGSISDAGQRIDALKPIEYEWKAGGKTRGFLAHQFAEVYPNSVGGEKDAVDEDGNPVYQGMQASTPEVIADLIAEIQSLRKRVATLEAK